MKSALVILAFLFSNSALAASYFVRPIQGASVPESDATAIQELVTSAVSQTPESSLAKSEDQADLVLVPKVMKLGQALILMVTKTSKDGTILAKEQARASNIEDMDTVAARVTRAVLTSTTMKEDVRVDDVTEDEVTRGKRRITSLQTRYFGFGPTTAWNLRSKGVGLNLEMGRAWIIDERFAINLGLRGFFFTASEAGGLGADATFEYNFNNRSTSPFASFGLGYAITAAHSTNDSVVSTRGASGFAAIVGIGIKTFRTSDINVAFGAKYYAVFAENSLGSPSALLGTVTFYY